MPFYMGRDLFLGGVITANLLLLIFATLNLDGTIAYIELGILGALIILFLFMSVFNQERINYILTLIYFCISLLNIPLLYFYSNEFIVITLAILNIFGFIHGLGTYEPRTITQTLVTDFSPREKKEMIKKELEPKQLPEFEVMEEYFYYVGSSSANKFHVIDCRHVKRIAQKNKVLFKSQQEAVDQGYEPCSCVD